MYDFAHPIEDAIERITHSVCTLEFEVHRPLYNWVWGTKINFFGLELFSCLAELLVNWLNFVVNSATDFTDATDFYSYKFG